MLTLIIINTRKHSLHCIKHQQTDAISGNMERAHLTRFLKIDLIIDMVGKYNK